MFEPVCPPRLSPGDTIALVAPSEPVDREDVEKTKIYLESLGYKLKLGKHLFYKIGDYTAGTIEDRAEDLNWAFADSEVKAIFVSVGGYAADQVLDILDYQAIKKNPKIFVGYSDATVVQFALLVKSDLISFSGPNGAGLFEMTEYSMKNLWRVLSGEKIERIEPVSKWEVLRAGKGKGIFVGGNLASMCALMGTQYDPFVKLKDEKILLFWEEFEDSYNEVIRNLFHLKNADVFDHCEGMLVGKLTNCSEEGGYVGVPELRYVLLQMARAFSFPILWNVDFGHAPDKITIPQGLSGEIDTKTMAVKFENCLNG